MLESVDAPTASGWLSGNWQWLMATILAPIIAVVGWWMGRKSGMALQEPRVIRPEVNGLPEVTVTKDGARFTDARAYMKLSFARVHCSRFNLDGYLYTGNRLLHLLHLGPEAQRVRLAGLISISTDGDAWDSTASLSLVSDNDAELLASSDETWRLKVGITPIGGRQKTVYNGAIEGIAVRPPRSMYIP